MNSQSPITLCIDPDGRGAWDLVISEDREHVSCATLDDAKRVAYRRAADRRPCELIVRDAYHRVIDRELIDIELHRSGTPGTGARPQG
jgi:hypothetical protein